MKINQRKMWVLLTIVMLCTAVYNLWALGPVTILYAETDWRSSVIVVDHFPLTDKDRINWFLNHESDIKKYYGIITEQTSSIAIIEAEDGLLRFQEHPHEDLLCFDNIKSDKKCVIKNYVLDVNIHAPGLVDFRTGDGPTYYLSEEGNIDIKPY